MNDIQQAATNITEAIELLNKAKKSLLNARSDQHIPLVLALGGIQQVHEILMDPDCTPEIAYMEPEQPDFCELPDHDPYIWDSERIEATKTVLFHEAIANGELYSRSTG